MPKATGPTYAVHFRRRREGRTDYGKRLGLLKGGMTRLVVRKTNRYVICQFVQALDQGDKILASATSAALKDAAGFDGKCNSPSAYLTGALAATRAKAKGVDSFILDLGLQRSTKGNVLYAAAKGAQDAGLKSNVGADILPSNDRIEGKHLDAKVHSAFGAAKAKLLPHATSSPSPKKQ